jgi:opacity protein-like surface antigen
VNFANDMDIEQFGSDGEIELDTGYVVELAGGYRHPESGLRGEFALGFRGNDNDDFLIEGESASDAGVGVDGSIDVVSAMFNAYWEPDLGVAVRPYVGAGAGIGYVKVELLTREEVEPDEFETFERSDDSDTVFAYQFMAGAAWEFSQTPIVALTLGYTYFATDDLDLKDGVGLPYSADGYESHAVMIGLRGTY